MDPKKIRTVTINFEVVEDRGNFVTLRVAEPETEILPKTFSIHKSDLGHLRTKGKGHELSLLRKIELRVRLALIGDEWGRNWPIMRNRLKALRESLEEYSYEIREEKLTSPPPKK